MHSNNLWVIFLSFFIALVFSIVSLPDALPVELGYLRPQWVALVLIYWVIALPFRVGIVVAWVAGIALDVLLSSLLGQHALALIIVAYVRLVFTSACGCLRSGSRVALCLPLSA